VKGQVLALTPLSVDFAFPSPVLLVQDDVLARNPQQFTIPENQARLFFISLLDNSDSPPEQCHAITVL
jgi:hypothetical protein